MQEVQVPVISLQQCQNLYQKKKIVVDERILCAGYPDGGKDACQVDQFA